MGDEGKTSAQQSVDQRLVSAGEMRQNLLKMTNVMIDNLSQL